MVELDDFRSDLTESSLLYMNAIRVLQCWRVEYCRYKATVMLGSASREILIRTTNIGASLKNSKLTVFHKSAKNFSVLPRVCHAHMRKSSRFESTPSTRPHRSYSLYTSGQRHDVSCPRGRSCIRKAFPVTLLLSALKFKKAYRRNIKNDARIIACVSSFAIKCGGRGSVVMKISASGSPSRHIETTFKPRYSATLT